MKRMNRYLKWAIILVVVAGLAYGGFRLFGPQSEESEATAFTEVVTVTRGDLTASISPTGEVVVKQRASLTFDVNNTELIELLVTAGRKVQEGDVLARIDASELERALDQAEADMLSAQDALEDALEPYSELDRKKSDLAVARAEVALRQAQDALDGIINPDIETLQEKVRQTEYNLESATLNLKLTQTSSQAGKKVRDLQYAVSWHERDYNNLKTRYDQGKISAETLSDKWEELANLKRQLAAAEAEAQSSLSDAEDKVAQVEEALADAQKELETGPDALEIAEAQSNLGLAEYDLAKAQDELDEILAGPKTKDINLAQARYDSAVAAYEEAEEAAENATMIAPFAGTVISTGAEVGDKVNTSKVIVTLADLDELEIKAWIDETKISKVKAGQKAAITFDAFPGQRFTGEVLEVPLEGTLRSNIVSYEVPVSLEGTEDINITPGMTANLTIITGTAEDALLVSVLAIQQGEDGNVVILQDAQGSTVVTPVQVGLSNSTYVQILRGLNEGDQVLVQYEAEENQMFGFGAMRSMTSPDGGGRPPEGR
ncbi:MAG: efflux RND transporter periplasmic adaptor subunit [Chloroflexota bacterium]